MSLDTVTRQAVVMVDSTGLNFVGSTASPLVTSVGASGLGTATAPITTLLRAADLIVTNTAAAGSAVTLTIPAVAGQFHYLTLLEITQFASVLLTAAATPVLVTSTNLNGSVAWSLSAQALAAGAVERLIYQFPLPVKSSVVNTNTTIVAPIATSVIWRITAHYYAAV